MSLQTQERTIDGVSFSVTQFPARAGHNLQIRLGKMLLPAIGALAGEAALGGRQVKAQDILDAEISGANVGAALNLLADRIPDNFSAFALELFQFTRADGREIKPAVYDELFAGRYELVYQALAFVVEVNGFFPLGAIGDRLAKLLAEKRPPMPPAPAPRAN